MASFQKTKDGKWRAFVARKGVRKSARFDTRQAARDWAARQEYLILNKELIASKQSVGDVFKRFEREVSPSRGGGRWESVRLRKLSKDVLASKVISELQASDVAEWRDRRLREVTGSTVAREMALLSAVFNVAVKEWGLMRANVVRDVRTPKNAPPRDRVPTQDEIERLLHVGGPDLSLKMGRVVHAFRFACETAMRAGEIVGLTREHVHIDRRFIHLPKTKNGHKRDVPLSSAALALLQELPDLDPVFGLSSRGLDATFRRLRDKAAIDDLHFHDSRRAGTTKLSKKLEPFELARVTGHRDLNLILSTYYKADVSDIASKLD